MFKNGNGFVLPPSMMMIFEEGSLHTAQPISHRNGKAAFHAGLAGDITRKGYASTVILHQDQIRICACAASGDDGCWRGAVDGPASHNGEFR